MGTYVVRFKQGVLYLSRLGNTWAQLCCPDCRAPSEASTPRGAPQLAICTASADFAAPSFAADPIAISIKVATVTRLTPAHGSGSGRACSRAIHENTTTASRRLITCPRSSVAVMVARATVVVTALTIEAAQMGFRRALMPQEPGRRQEPQSSPRLPRRWSCLTP